MNISRTSWHYKLNKWCWSKIDYWEEPKDLCTYFWLTIALPFLGVILLFVVAACLAVATVWAVGPLYWGTYILFFDNVFQVIECVRSDGSIIKDCEPGPLYFWSWFPLGLYGLQLWAWWAAYRWFVADLQLTPDAIRSTLSLVKEGAVALKEGYCPLISFKDE